MTKRFSDTDIWREDWFLELPAAYMLFWSWVRSHCDFAGFYKPNKAAFERTTEQKIELDKALQLFNGDRKTDEKRVLVLPNGKWFLTGFIPFQYGRVLNLGSKVHNSIHNQLLQNEVALTSIRPPVEVRQGVKEKEKDIDIETTTEKKVMDKEWSIRFDQLWATVPKLVGKKEAWRHFKADMKTDGDWTAIQKALANYKQYLITNQTERQFIMNGATWLNNWRDWENYQEPTVGVSNPSTPDIPYACPLCNKRFLAMAAIEPHICPLCKGIPKIQDMEFVKVENDKEKK